MVQVRQAFLFVVLGLIVGCQAEPSAISTTPTPADSKAMPSPESVAVDVADPTSASPVAWGASLDHTPVAVGETVLLVVRAKIASGWHIYAAEGEVGVGRPTKLNLQLPAGMTMAGDWTLPHAEVKSSALGDVSEYHGTANFSVPVKIEAGAQSGSIACGIDFQSCTDKSCLRPTSTEVSIPFTVE